MKAFQLLHSKKLLLLSVAAMTGCTSWYSTPPNYAYVYPPAQAVYYYPPGPTNLPPQNNYVPPPQKAIDPREMDSTKYTAQQLDQMLGPIALYPDPLLTAVLTASTQPSQLSDLNQFLKTNAAPTDDQVGAQPWDTSVKGLAKFPDVVKMMADKMDWTQALGYAMVNQQTDVMDSIQRLRAQASANKTLPSNEYQQIVESTGTIQIIPTQPDVIYVPYYDPYAVFTVGFGIGFGFGWPYYWYGGPCYTNHYWDHHCDWKSHTIQKGMTWGNWNKTYAGGATEWKPAAGTKIAAPTTAFKAPRPVDQFHNVSRVSRVPASPSNSAVSPSASSPPAFTPPKSTFSGPTGQPRVSPIAIPSSPSGDHHRDTRAVFSGPSIAPVASPSIAPQFSPSMIPSSPSVPAAISSPSPVSSPPQRMVIPVAPSPIISSPSRGTDFHGVSPNISPSPSFSPSFSSSPTPAPSVPSSPPAQMSSPPPSRAPAPAPAPIQSSPGGGGHRGGR